MSALRGRAARRPARELSVALLAVRSTSSGCDGSSQFSSADALHEAGSIALARFSNARSKRRRVSPERSQRPQVFKFRSFDSG